MVARRKKQFSAGEGSNYVSRKQAMKKLQLNLKDFRRLCILKGIHPREPRNRKRAQKGNMSKIQTLFHEKDIRFLLHEPIVWKFREFKVFLRKVKKAQDKGNYETVERLHAGGKPKYTLDHIVKERYPTFVDAVRDLEDCLCLCFLYSTFPVSVATPAEKVSLCKRLTIEFMHYVIEAKALRKVFVSIKGYYYQAEILGQTVTWIVPHPFAYAKPENVDFKLMSIFVDFYTTMLGFVNFRLFHKLNLKYPPALVGFSTEAKDKTDTTEEAVSDRVAALNQSLLRTVANDEPDASEGIDVIAANGEEADEERMAEARKQADELTTLQNLFKGLKFFISREVPRESLVFLVRAFGGEVSWDSTAAAAGATFGEDDVSVTHQICDRPKAALAAAMAKHVERFYIQPQWVFDSVNQRKLLAVHEYFVGETLPAHLSPFVSTERRVGDYMPPEERRLLGLEQEEEEEEQQQEEEEDQVEAEEEEDDDDDEDEDDEDDDDDEEEEEEDETPAKKSGMKVEAGRMEREDADAAAAAMAAEEMRLRTSMIKKKHRGLYKSMMKARKKRVHESKQLERKRNMHDESAKQQKKQGAKTKGSKKQADAASKDTPKAANGKAKAEKAKGKAKSAKA